MRENKYYNTEIDIIADFMAIFDIIPTGESHTFKAFVDKDGNFIDSAINKKGIKKQITRSIQRRANDSEEFATVFENEFRKADAYDKEVFKERHIEICQAKRDELIQFNNQALEHHIHTLDRYIKFLQHEITPKKREANFSDFLTPKEPEKIEQLIKELKELFPTGGASESANMFFALVKTGLSIEPTDLIDAINAIRIEWGTKFRDESFYKVYRQNGRLKETDYKSNALTAINKIKRIKL